MSSSLGFMGSGISGHLIPPSSFESIATITPSGTNSVTFSSIPSTWTHLQVRFNGVSSSAAGSWYMRFNGDSGANYTNHWLAGSGSAASAGGNTGRYSIAGLITKGGVATYPSVGIIDVLDYTSTTENKVGRYFAGADNNSTGGSIELTSGVWLNTSAITSLTLYYDYTLNSGTTIALYGIKGA